MTIFDRFDNAPQFVRAKLTNSHYRKANGDLSVAKVKYSGIRTVGRFVVNQVPMKDRDAFIKQFVMKKPLDFYALYKKSKHRDYRWK